MPPGQRMCSQGSNCDGFGTLKGCNLWHDPKAVQFIRDQHGSNFISKQTRKLVLDLRQAERAAALVPPTAPQPAAPLPVTTAESAPANRAQMAVEHLARLKEAQQNYSGCALTVPIAPVHAEPSRVHRNSGSATVPVGAAGEPDTILPNPPIAANSRQPAPSLHTAHTCIERTAEPIPTVLGVSRPVPKHERIERSKRIDTPAEPAWRVLIDFEHYATSNRTNSGRSLRSDVARSSHRCRCPGSLLLPRQCDTRRRHRPIVMVRLQPTDACSPRHWQRRLRPRPSPIDVPSVFLTRANLPSACQFQYIYMYKLPGPGVTGKEADLAPHRKLGGCSGGSESLLGTRMGSVRKGRRMLACSPYSEKETICASCAEKETIRGLPA
jgi:hypothetical protein